MDSRLQRARELLQIEAQAVERCAANLGPSFLAALDLIEECLSSNKKLVFMGVGKSHYVAHKLAASFMSTGVTAIFVHPSEAFHGDLGSLREGDVLFLLSKSGATAEILGLLPFVKGKNPIVAITGDLQSPLALQSTVVLDASIEKEACPINMLPTASTTVALALGDALMASFAESRGFSKRRFANYHPGGSIGKRLNQKVADVFNPKEKVAYGNAEVSLQEVAKAMGEKPLGAFCILDEQGKLSGLLTDGDLRRAMARGVNPSSKAREIMNSRPIVLKKEMLIDEAIASMEQSGRRINCAPIVSEDGFFMGLVHIHDLI